MQPYQSVEGYNFNPQTEVVETRTAKQMGIESNVKSDTNLQFELSNIREPVKMAGLVEWLLQSGKKTVPAQAASCVTGLHPACYTWSYLGGIPSHLENKSRRELNEYCLSNFVSNGGRSKVLFNNVVAKSVREVYSEKGRNDYNDLGCYMKVLRTQVSNPKRQHGEMHLP